MFWGSEVLGYDDEESTDHHWGPRFILLMSEEDLEKYEKRVSDALSANLPYKFRGYSTNFVHSGEGDVHLPKEIDSGAVNHMVHIESMRSIFGWYLGFNLEAEPTLADWLTFSEHKLLTVTSGKVFHDGLGKLEEVRRKLAYYPENVWLYLLACQWKYISDEEAFVGRSGFVGDELGSAVVAARLVKNLMRLCFLLERRYAPYSKWFGTAFSRLSCAAELTPILRDVLCAADWKEREAHLSKAYEAVARMHNALGITRPVEDKVSKHGRPYMIIHARRFGMAVLERLASEEMRRLEFSEEIRRLGFFGGSVNQLVESDDEISQLELCRRLRVLYEPHPGRLENQS
jgi:hypothetical protein